MIGSIIGFGAYRHDDRVDNRKMLLIDPIIVSIIKQDRLIDPIIVSIDRKNHIIDPIIVSIDKKTTLSTR